MPRFLVCPQCNGKDIEVFGDSWLCWDCDWTEPLNEEELKELNEGSLDI